MMQVMAKWKVTVEFTNHEKNVTFWVHDNFVANVLRKVADLDFSGDGLDQPICIIVGGPR